MDFSHFFKKITRSLNVRRTKPVEADNSSSLSQIVPNRILQDPYLFYPPPLTSTRMSCPSPSSRLTEPAYPKHYAIKRAPHFQCTNTNFSQTAVDPLSSPEQFVDSESDSGNSFMPPPSFQPSPNVSSDYNFLFEERSKPPTNIYEPRRNLGRKLRSLKTTRPTSRCVPLGSELSLESSTSTHCAITPPSKHQPLSTETLVPPKLSSTPSSPLKAQPLTKNTHNHAKYMIKLSLSIQELARVVAPPGSFKMPRTHNSPPFPNQPKIVRVQPALDPPQFLTGEVMLWESYSRKSSKGTKFSR